MNEVASWARARSLHLGVPDREGWTDAIDEEHGSPRGTVHLVGDSLGGIPRESADTRCLSESLAIEGGVCLCGAVRSSENLAGTCPSAPRPQHIPRYTTRVCVPIPTHRPASILACGWILTSFRIQTVGYPFVCVGGQLSLDTHHPSKATTIIQWGASGLPFLPSTQCNPPGSLDMF